MKLLLLAGNPDTSSTLGLDREITALQRRFLEASGEPFEFIPLPHLRVEDLSRTLRTIEPDILHVTAHGETSHLVLADAAGTAAEITPERLRAFLSSDKPPKLVYFNGCKSSEMAKDVLGPVGMSIGTAATIDNRSARNAAVAFYERVLAGDSVHFAFAAAKALAGAIGRLDLELHAREGVDPSREVLLPRPRLIARFAKVQQGPDRAFPIRIGVAQCPKPTIQLVAFFEGAASCASTRPEWDDGIAWVRTELSASADRRVFVAGLIGGGGRFIAEGKLREALIDQEREEVRWAVGQLMMGQA